MGIAGFFLAVVALVAWIFREEPSPPMSFIISLVFVFVFVFRFRESASEWVRCYLLLEMVLVVALSTSLIRETPEPDSWHGSKGRKPFSLGEEMPPSCLLYRRSKCNERSL